MNKEKAYFLQRLGAFFVDSIILGFFVSLITMPLFTDQMNTLSAKSFELAKMIAKNINSMDSYVAQSMDISFQYAKLTGIITLISIACYILYFVVLQHYLKGQTLGKKLFKVKIVKLDGSSLSLNDLIIRNIINNGIIFDFITFIFVFTNKKAYFYGSGVVAFVESIVLLVSVFMIIIRKDGRSICDIIAKTKVVKAKEE